MENFNLKTALRKNNEIDSKNDMFDVFVNPDPERLKLIDTVTDHMNSEKFFEESVLPKFLAKNSCSNHLYMAALLYLEREVKPQTIGEYMAISAHAAMLRTDYMKRMMEAGAQIAMIKMMGGEPTGYLKAIADAATQAAADCEEGDDD